MKFFIPDLKDAPEAAEERWAHYLRESPAPADSKRVYSLTYHHDGDKYEVTVGQRRKCYRRQTGPRGLAESALAPGRSEGRRRGQVCTVAGLAVFDDDPGGVEPLLSRWGGEAIYWAHERSALGERLGALGKPSVVVAGLRLAAHSRPPCFFPALANLFVGRHMGLQEVHGDVFLYGPVAAEDIAGIWQPGHREYDRHRFLPRR